MKLWIGVVVVVVFLVLILIIVGIVKSKKKKQPTEVVNTLTGGRQPDGTVVDPLMEQIKVDYENCITDNDAAERLRKIRELYNIEK